MDGLNEILSLVFNATLVRSTIRAATPILYATLACVLTQQANILNIGIEGIMIFAAFAAVTTSYFAGSWVLGLLAAIITGVVVAAFMAFAHLKAKADIFVVGMGVNMLAIAMTRFLLQRTFGVSGSFHHNDIVPMPRLNFDFGGNALLPGEQSTVSVDEYLNHKNREFMLKVPPKLHHNRPCYFPWRYVHVNPDGTVFPCGSWWEHTVFGDFKTQTFEEIWLGPQFTELRRQLGDHTAGTDRLPESLASRFERLTCLAGIVFMAHVRLSCSGD